MKYVIAGLKITGIVTAWFMGCIVIGVSAGFAIRAMSLL